MTVPFNALATHEVWPFAESFVPQVWLYVMREKDARAIKKLLLAVTVRAPSKDVDVVCCINLEFDFLYFVWLTTS